VAEDFATAAARFCSVVEGGGVPRAWVGKVEVALSDVYASALRLPSVGSISALPVVRMSSEEWSALYAALGSMIGDDDRYWRMTDPSDGASVVSSSLADDLAEIYRSLRLGLEAMRSGAPPDDVLFEWRAGFELHWATHAIGALSALRNAQRNL
jgi:hypothetical protein